MAPEQSDFVVQLSRAFATQGVLLVVVPVPGRGAIRPAALYLDDPKQAAYSPTVTRANYDAYIKTLEQNGVAAVDVMAVATAFDASGGQTFFKRDLHWTPEGSNAVAQVTAERIRRTIDKPLAKAQLTLNRDPTTKHTRGGLSTTGFPAHAGLPYRLNPSVTIRFHGRQETFRRLK